MGLSSLVPRVATSLAAARSQTLAVVSELPLARYLPSWEKASDQTEPPCCARRARVFRPATSQRSTVPAASALTSCEPSGEKATAKTGALCPSRAPFSRPVAGSQSLIDRSQLAV